MSEILVSSKLVCVALNDAGQRKALQATFEAAPYNKPPTQPVLYYKPRNTWAASGAVIPWATDADGDAAGSMVVGGSLGVVIGQRTCRVSEEDALSYVGGYTVVGDYSLPEATYYRPDVRGKCQDGTGPVGPAVTPASDVANPDALEVVISVNGNASSRFPLSEMHDSVAALISTISKIMTLQPGDVIATGFRGERTPVAPGDSVAIEIAGVGTLENTLGGRD